MLKNEIVVDIIFSNSLIHILHKNNIIAINRLRGLKILLTLQTHAANNTNEVQ